MNLKFRVINLETGQVTYHNGIFNDKIDGNIRIDQYTGKHDIFGEEIYEGDTVTHRIIHVFFCDSRWCYFNFNWFIY